MLFIRQKEPALNLVIVSAIAFFLLALIFTLHRHFTFYSSYDQGIFNQVYWNGIHGRFFQSSLSSQLSTNVVHAGEVSDVSYHRLGQHFTPALLLWIPLYALFPSPATLLVLKVTLITVAGLVLYVLAKQYLEPPLAAMITVSYYCANAVIGPTLGNFHDICQIPLFVFTLLLAMEKRWWWLFWLMAVLVLSVREDSGVELFGIGFYMIISKRFPRAGLAVCTLSFVYMIALTNLIMPLFSKDISQRFMIEQFGQYVDGKEASTLDIIWGIISNPLRLIVELFTPVLGTFKYLFAQWLPLAFVPAVAPASWMIAGFPLLKLFLGKAQSALSINIRYAMTIVPGLFYGAIIWWSYHPQLFKKLSFRRFWVTCLTLSVVFTLIASPHRTFYFIFPDSYQPFVYVPLTTQWQRVNGIRSLLAQIPADASVSATNTLIPHLSSRREIIRLDALQLRNDQGQVNSVDYIIADMWQLQKYQVAFKDDRERLQKITALINKLNTNQEYGIIGFENGVVLMQKAVASAPSSLSAWQDFTKQLEPLLDNLTNSNP